MTGGVGRENNHHKENRIMQRRFFLKAVVALTAGLTIKLPEPGEIQHWKNGNFGQFIWTGENPRRLCYKGKFPPNLWEDFKAGVNLEDRSDWRAVVEEIKDLQYVLDRLPRENFVRV
jgi:hypothetical protein